MEFITDLIEPATTLFVVIVALALLVLGFRFGLKALVYFFGGTIKRTDRHDNYQSITKNYRISRCAERTGECRFGRSPCSAIFRLFWRRGVLGPRQRAEKANRSMQQGRGCRHGGGIAQPERCIRGRICAHARLSPAPSREQERNP